MSAQTYKLSFPCPECGGVLTMSAQSSEGDCPICKSTISANLDIQVVKSKTKLNSPERGWNKRAFRRPATTSKPMWKPVHERPE